MVNSVEWKQLGISVFLFFSFYYFNAPVFLHRHSGSGKKKKRIVDFSVMNK